MLDALNQRLQHPQHGSGCTHFGGVDVAVAPKCRLVICMASRLIGDRRQPDVPPLMALADAGDLDEMRILTLVGVQQLGELVVAVIAVELDIRHAAMLPRSAVETGRWGRGCCRSAGVTVLRSRVR